jgi:hypothetical protein
MTAIKDIFYKDIERSINGVVKADQNDDSTVYVELDEYVVTKELDQHFREFFEVFSTSLNDKSLEDKIGVWISGFFGSGKSHFLKILSYLLANVESTSPSGDKKRAAHARFGRELSHQKEHRHNRQGVAGERIKA